MRLTTFINLCEWLGLRNESMSSNQLPSVAFSNSTNLGCLQTLILNTAVKVPLVIELRIMNNSI